MKDRGSPGPRRLNVNYHRGVGGIDYVAAATATGKPRLVNEHLLGLPIEVRQCQVGNSQRAGVWTHGLWRTGNNETAEKGFAWEDHFNQGSSDGRGELGRRETPGDRRNDQGSAT